MIIYAHKRFSCYELVINYYLSKIVTDTFKPNCGKFRQQKDVMIFGQNLVIPAIVSQQSNEATAKYVLPLIWLWSFKIRNCTKVVFTSFSSGELTIAVLNPPDVVKLENPTSVQLCTLWHLTWLSSYILE